MRRTATIFLALAFAVLGATCHSSGRVFYTGVYISLGDSIAAGNGSSDPATTSFVALIDHDEGGLPLINLAKAGATTQDVIDKQLQSAVGAMNGRDVAFITISAGGNDLAALIPNPSCVQDPLPASCPLDATLQKVEANLDAILSRLRSGNQTAPIVLLAYPNLFSETGHPFEAPAARVLPRLDDVIRAIASKYPHTLVADPSAAFQGQGGELTHVLDTPFDPHPNDAGHRVIADAFIAVLRVGP
jgi:lysophospholipase L1-like esterase